MINYIIKNQILMILVATSYWSMEDIIESQIKYLCPFDNSSIGFPIFNLSNNKIIGTHQKGNFGIILSSAINYIIIFIILK